MVALPVISANIRLRIILSRQGRRCPPPRAPSARQKGAITGDAPACANPPGRPPV